MKLLIDKNNKTRFTMSYKLVEDKQKIDQEKYMEYGINASHVFFRNVIFEGEYFEYQPYTRTGIICQVGQNNKKFIFEIDGDKIINRTPFDSTLDIQDGSLIVKAVFAYDKKVTDIENVMKKFETNLRCQVMDRIEKQIQQLMVIKGNLQFD